MPSDSRQWYSIQYKAPSFPGLHKLTAYVFCMLLVALALPQTSALSQSSIEQIEMFTQHVDDSITATLHFPDFHDLIGRIETHSGFAAPEFIEGVEALKKFDPELIEKWDAFLDCLRRIDSVHVFVWQSETPKFESNQRQSPEWKVPAEIVVAIKISDAEELAEKLSFFNGFFQKSKSLDSENADERPDQSKNPTASLALQTQNGWLIIGNSKTRVDSLRESLASGVNSKNSLARDRKFQIAFQEFKGDANASIFMFARPQYFPSLFSDSRGFTSLAAIENLGELPAAAVIVQFEEASANLVIKSFVTNTFPAVGLANQLNAMSPIPEDIPEFCFDVTSTEMWAWDADALLKANKENYVSTHGEAKYLEYLKQRYGENSENLNRDFYQGTSSIVLVRYRSHIGKKGGITIRRVKDYEAQKRLLEYYVKNSQEQRGAKGIVQLKNLPASAIDAFAIGPTPEEIEEKWRRALIRIKNDPEERKWYERELQSVLEKTGKSLEEFGSELAFDNDGHVLTKDWCFTGPLPDIYRLIEYMHGEIDEVEDTLKSTKKRIKQLKDQTGFGSVEMIYTGDVYIDDVSEVFEESLYSKYGLQNFQLVKDIGTGVTLKQLQNEEKFEGDIYDITGYLVCKAVTEPCEDIVILRRKDEQGGKLKTVIGVFYKEDEKE
jgi:hypothetical protein